MSKIHVHATLKIRIGAYDRFCEEMAKQIPVLERQGWRLAGAWLTAVGRVPTVIHLWELPDADTFFEGTARWRASPEFPGFRAMSADVVDEEMVTFVKKTPYSP